MKGDFSGNRAEMNSVSEVAKHILLKLLRVCVEIIKIGGVAFYSIRV
jgi:hypothetical protein